MPTTSTTTTTKVYQVSFPKLVYDVYVIEGEGLTKEEALAEATRLKDEGEEPVEEVFAYYQDGGQDDIKVDDITPA